MAAPLAYVGSFAKRSGTGTQAITGVGFQPKALIFWSTARSATGFADANYQHFHGFSDGTNHTGVAHLSQDANATGLNSTADAHRNDACLVIVDSTGTADSIGAVASMDADGFTINWSVAAGFAGVLINFIALAGDTLEAKVGDVSTSSSTGPQSFTGVGFRPTALLCLAVLSSAGTTASIGFGPLGFGWGSRLGQGASTTDSVHNSPYTRDRYQRTTDIIAAKGSGGFGYEGSLSSFDSDGFTINWTTARSARLPYLALKGCVATVGALTQPTSTGDQVISLPGIDPVLVCLMSVNNVASTTNDNENRFSFGASDGAHQRATWAGDNQGTFPTQTATYQSSTSAIAMATPSASSSTMNAEASLGTFTNGFTLTWGTADATARQVLYFAISADDGTDYSDGDPGPLATMTLTDRSGVDHPWAEVDMNDRGVYYGGFKSARLLAHQVISRAMSGFRGVFNHVSFGGTVSDTDRSVRGLSDDATTKYLMNCPLVTRTFSDEDRRAERLQHVEMCGYVSEPNPKEDFQYDFTGIDWLKKRLARKTQAPEFWQVLLTRADFPTLSDALVNKAAPLPYGYLSDEVPDIVLSDIPADLYPQGGFDPGWIKLNAHGWGSGSFSPGWVYAYPLFIKGGVVSTVVPPSIAFDMSGPSPAMQVQFRCAAVPDLFRIVFSDSSDFHPFSNPTAGTYARYVDFTPASIPEGNNPYGGGSPDDANDRFALIDSPTMGGDYHALVKAGGTTVISPSKGAWPTLYVGELVLGGVSKSVFLVGFGALDTIESVFVGGARQTSVGSGTEIECPFLGDFASVYGANYITINGRRWTPVLATGQTAVNAVNGSAPITVNRGGYETVGDTSGTRIDALIEIARHFACNFLASEDAVTGAWRTTTPTLPTGAPMVDDLSFDTAAAAIATALSGGRVGGGGISVGGEYESALDILASLAAEGDFELEISRQGALMASVEPKTAPATATELSDILDITDRSFSAKAAYTQNFWNDWQFTHTKDYTGQTQEGWLYTGSVQDAASITNYQQQRTAQLWNMRWLRSKTSQGQATITDVVQRERLRYRHPLRTCTLTVPYLSGAGLEIGDVIRLTHAEGISASGWTGHDVRVSKIDTDLNQWVRKFEAYDLQPVYDGLEDSVEPTSQSVALKKDTIGSLQDRVTSAQADVSTLQRTVDALETELANKITGPASATDNGIVRFDATTGKLAQNTSGPTMPDDGRISNVTDPTSAQDAATKAYADALAPSTLTMRTSDPGSPTNGTAWLFNDGGSPASVSIRVRLGGVTYDFQIGTATT